MEDGPQCSACFILSVEDALGSEKAASCRKHPNGRRRLVRVRLAPANLPVPSGGKAILWLIRTSPRDWHQAAEAVDIQRKAIMPWKSPWHSILQYVHHNNTACTEGNNIEPRYLQHGTGNKPLCEHCRRLALEGR
jgi:hypothetical protein